MWPLNTQWGLPQVLIDQLEVLCRQVKNNKTDSLGVVVGAERMGKSVLTAKIAKYAASYLGSDLQLRRDYSYRGAAFVESLSTTSFNGSETPEKGGLHAVKVWDEGIMGGNSRKWGTVENILVNETLATIGYKYLFMMACIPNPFMFDNLIREHRVAFCCRVFGTIDQSGDIEKGYFNLYNATDFRNIYKNKDTGQIVWPKTKFAGMPFEGFKDDPWWAEYEKDSARQKGSINKANLEMAKAIIAGKVVTRRAAMAEES